MARGAARTRRPSRSRWLVYLLRCRDGSLYTGITNDLDRRLKAHAAGKASRYTRSRLPVTLAYSEPQPSKSAALKREAAIKRLQKCGKERFLAGPKSRTINNNQNHPTKTHNPMKLTDYTKTRFPIYEVCLDEPPETRWHDVAAGEHKNIAAILRDTVKESAQHADQLPTWLRPSMILAGKGLARLGGRITNFVADMFGGEYAAEIRSIAATTNQSLGYVTLGNLIYDLTQIGGHWGVGCSSFSCDIEGMPTLVRNMDWVTPRSTGKYTRLIKFCRGKEHYLSVSVLGCVGVVSAMCPGKWAVTINQAPMNGTKPGYLQWPVLQRLRACCDKMGTYEELVADLQTYQTMTSFFAHVIGTKPGQHTVITGTGNTFWEREPDAACLLQTNHFVGEDLEHHNPPEEWEQDGTVWFNDTYRRLRSLKRRLPEPPKTLSAARKEILGGPVTTTDTMQQMVFQPATGEWRVWVRR